MEFRISKQHSLPPLLPKVLCKAQLNSSVLNYISTCFFPSKNQRLVIIDSSRSASYSLLVEASDDLQTRFRLYDIQSEKPLDREEVEVSNKIIRKVCGNSQTEALAYQYYLKAKAQQDFRPERRTLRFLFGCLLKFKQWSSISELIADIKIYNVFPDSYTCGRLVKGCIKARKFKLAESLLRMIENVDGNVAASAFSSAMHGYNQFHMYKCTVSVYERMVTNAIPLNSRSYRGILEAYQELGNAENVLALFLEYRSNVSEPCNDTVGIYSIVCEALGRCGRAFEALKYIREIEEMGVELNSSIYASLISSFAGIREAKIAEELFGEAAKKGLLKNQDTVLKLIVMYVNLGFMEKTLVAVEISMKAGITVSDCIFSTIINGFVQKKGAQAAVLAYRRLISFGCEPGQVTYASIINAYNRLGLHRKAELIFKEMIEKGFDKCVVAYSTMISMYSKIGKVQDAMKLLAKMKEKGCQPNVWVYNSLLNMHGRLMNLKQVDKLWQEMKRRKVSPDRVSYTSIINAYSIAGKLDESLNFFEEFKMNGGQVDRALAGIMVGVLSKESRFDKLIELLQDMESSGTSLDERLYESVLNSLIEAGIKVQGGLLQNFEFRKEKT